jgi:hypothetical protein
MAMNPRLLRPLATGFDPRSIANLTFWMDSLSASTYTQSSGQITEWRSRVGSLKFGQATANNRPTLFESSSDVQGSTAAVINGRQALYFDGTNDQLSSNATVTGPQWTTFAVARSDSVTADRGVFTRDINGLAVADRGPQALGHTPLGAVRTLGISTTAGFTATAGTMSNGVAAVLHSVQTASDLRAFLNNVGGTAVSGVQNSSATIATIGSHRLFTSTFWQGTIGEILYYERALSADEQTKVYQYLRLRWGIA